MKGLTSDDSCPTPEVSPVAPGDIRAALLGYLHGLDLGERIGVLAVSANELLNEIGLEREAALDVLRGVGTAETRALVGKVSISLPSAGRGAVRPAARNRSGR